MSPAATSHSWNCGGDDVMAHRGDSSQNTMINHYFNRFKKNLVPLLFTTKKVHKIQTTSLSNCYNHAKAHIQLNFIHYVYNMKPTTLRPKPMYMYNTSFPSFFCLL